MRYIMSKTKCIKYFFVSKISTIDRYTNRVIIVSTHAIVTKFCNSIQIFFNEITPNAC